LVDTGSSFALGYKWDPVPTKEVGKPLRILPARIVQDAGKAFFELLINGNVSVIPGRFVV